MRDHGISGFLSKFTKGVAKPNKYRVEFNMPRGVSLADNSMGSNINAMNGRIRTLGLQLNAGGAIDIKCHTANLPQRSLMTYEHKQNSAPVRLPYSSTYDPVTFSFYANSRYDTRTFFETWQSAVMNFGTNTVNFYDEYKADVQIITLDDYGNDAYKVTLFDAYPLNIGVVDLSYSQVNNYQTVTVTMSFRHWLPWTNAETR